MRKTIIAGNWKMNHTGKDMRETITALAQSLTASVKAEIVVAPVFPYLAEAVTLAKGTPIHIAAQNMHWLDNGAYTGEVAPAMLVDIGVTHVIIGHSERREYNNETDETVRLKVKSALDHGLTPILCCGEWAGAAVRVYHCLIPPFAVQWRRNFIGKYSSAGLPLVASNSRLFLFLLQNRDEQLLPWLNLSGIRDMVAVHGPVNHDPYIFPVVIDFGADVPKSFILIHHDNLINVFRFSHQRFDTGRDAKGNGRQDDNCQANPPPSVTMLFSRPSHLRHLPFRNLLMKYT